MDKTEMDKTEDDDGSLSFLKIPEQDDNKQFHGKEISQSELVNTSFWVLDITLTNTKFGKDRMLVRGKHELEDDKEFKFFTNSQEIKYKLSKIQEMGKFPRKMKMKGSGNRYWVE